MLQYDIICKIKQYNFQEIFYFMRKKESYKERGFIEAGINADLAWVYKIREMNAIWAFYDIKLGKMPICIGLNSSYINPRE